MQNSVPQKTPYFIIDENALDNNFYYLRQSLDNVWQNNIIGYSYKTNALPWIINHFNELGCYAEVVSSDEYKLAISIGVEKDHIIYNGIAKTKDTFLEAIRNHAFVNIDSEYEIEWLKELEEGDYSVGIRCNFDLETRCPGQSQCGDEGERFGFCYENGELKRAIDLIEEYGVKVAGLHLHKSSKTRMPEIYRAIAETAVEITKSYNLSLSYIDIGGGFFGGLKTKPQFPEYFSTISSILKRQFDPANTTIIIEPGMAVIGAAVDYITTVLDIKKTIRNVFIVTDGSRTQIDPLMTKSNYFFEINRLSGKRVTIERQTVTGFTCMEHDRLFELFDDREILPGDKIIYHKVGAYTMCLSPLFIKWFPEVYLKRKDGVMRVRDQWLSEDYKNRSILE